MTVNELRELLKLNRYDFNLYLLQPKIGQAILELPLEDFESSEEREQLNLIYMEKLVEPIYSQRYTSIFKKFHKSHSIQISEVVNTRTLPIIMQMKSILNNLAEFADYATSDGRAEMGNGYVASVIYQMVTKLSNAMEVDDEMQWAYLKFLHDMVVGSLIRYTCYYNEIADVVEYIKSVNEVKIQFLKENYEEDSFFALTRIDSYEAENELLTHRSRFDSYIDKKQKYYTNKYQSAKTDNEKSYYSSLHTNLINIRESYNPHVVLKNGVEDMFTEYLTLMILNEPSMDLLAYHTPKEFYDITQDQIVFNKIFSGEVIRDFILNLERHNYFSDAINIKTYKAELDLLLEYGLVGIREIQDYYNEIRGDLDE